MCTNIERLIQCLKNLTGQDIQDDRIIKTIKIYVPFTRGPIGYTQFNELLLMLGYDRTSRPFFHFLFGDAGSITTLEQFEDAVDNFRKKAMVLFGNVKFGFKKWGQASSIELEEVQESFAPNQIALFQSRNHPVMPVSEIPPEDTWKLGYISGSTENADDIRKKGEENLNAYLTYDHLDGKRLINPIY